MLLLFYKTLDLIWISLKKINPAGTFRSSVESEIRLQGLFQLKFPVSPPLLPVFPSGHLRYCSEKSPCGPESISPTDLHVKETSVNLLTAVNMLSLYSLCCISLSHRVLIFVKVFQLCNHCVRAARLGQRHDGSNITAHIQWAAYPESKPGS